MRQPRYFVGLHSHSTYSTFDAIGTPQDHIDFAIENGMDSLALTDHGNMNGFSHQYLHSKKIAEKGIKFKPIFGVEAYFVPDLKKWSEIHQELKKQKNKKEEEIEEASEEDTEGGTIIEIEEESKNKDNNKKEINPFYDRSHLVLLAKNNTGLKSIFRLVSESYIHGFYRYPRIDFELLRKHANGNIVATTACLAGYPGKIIFGNQNNEQKIQVLLKEMVETFWSILGKDNFFLEIQFNKIPEQHFLNKQLITCSLLTGCPLVVTVDAHYHKPEYWREREIYKLIGKMQTFKEIVKEQKEKIEKTIDELECELYPKNAEQLWKYYQNLKNSSEEYQFYDDNIVADAIERTYDIAHHLIGTVEPEKTVKLPSLQQIANIDHIDINVKSEDDYAFEYLKKLAIEGFHKRKLYKKPNYKEYIDRLELELNVIKTLKFSKYFITYHKIIEIIENHMLIGNARGSAGGSLLAYLLNITQVDPIKYGLLFERFLTTKKKSFPDIDSDFADRDQAVKLLQKYFGSENVIPVSNFAQLQLASLIKDLSRIFGLPFQEVNEYTTKMRNEALAVAKQTPGFDAAQWEFTLEVAERYSSSYNEFIKKVEKYPEFMNALNVLFKQQRTISKHAGGVIITNNSKDNMPLIKAKGGLQTPWPEGITARHLEEFGFLKFDILGLGTLRMFEQCIAKILQKEGKIPNFENIKKFFYEKLHPDNNNFDDLRVYKNVYWDGNYAGIFQFVKPNVQNFMKLMKPKSILDIAIATSIHRPGPLGLEADKLFLENKKNPKNIKYIHPAVKEVLEETCGLLIFQEQLQLLVHKLSGMSLDETDSIRKAFTKKDISNKEKQKKELEELEKRFVEDSMKHSGLTKEQALSIWDDFKKWTAYGFNKSHAVAYAITSYQCAWFLTYYPDEWITTYLDYCSTSKGKVTGQEDPRDVAFMEARALGYQISKPDINFSDNHFIVKENKTIIPSFSSIKGIGKNAIEEIKSFRPYRTIHDLIMNPDGSWRHQYVNKKVLEHLIKIGALESMNIVGINKTLRTYKQLYEIIIDHYDDMRRISKRKNGKEELRKYIDSLIEEVAKNNQNAVDWTLEEKIEYSKDIFGYVDFEMILPEKVMNYFGKNQILPLHKAEKIENNQRYWAVILNIDYKTTKNGKQYVRMKFFNPQAIAQQQYSDMYFNFWTEWKTIKEREIKKYDIIIGHWRKNNYGLSVVETENDPNFICLNS